MLNALSIDVEEHFQVHAFASVIQQQTWEEHNSRVVPNTQRILDLLAAQKVRATFFVLGWVADRHPNLVREIAAGGHEIGTHGYAHQLVYEQTPAEFAADLDRSLAAIKRACPETQLLGYRAPAFSVTKQSLWALDVLHERKLRYDSSIFPLAAHDRYGIRDAPRFANRLQNGLWEFPVSTLQVGKQNVPVAGGGYFRLYPFWATRYAIRRINSQGQASVVYLHPWEFDPDQPRIQGASLLSRFRHYTNLTKTYDRLKSLINEFQFAPIQEVFAQQLAA